MNLIKTFILNTLILITTNLILRCISIFFNSYISQKIGSEALGLYGLIMSIYGLAITIALSGINLTTTKIITEELSFGNTKDISKIIKKCLLFSLLFSSIAGILLIISSPYICKLWLHNKISNIPFYIIAISLPFISMSSALSGYFTAIRNSIKPACDQILEQIMKVILISAFLNYFMPSGLEYICISLILGNIISEICSFLFIYTLYKIDIKKYKTNTRSNTYYEKRILGITIPVGLTSFIRSGLSTLKQILIPFGFEKHGFSCKQALSNYGIISGMVIPLIMFPNIIILSFSSLLIPEFTEFNVRANNARITKTSTKILKYSSIFSIFIAIIIFIYADYLCNLMYKTNSISNYVQILAPLIPFMYVDNVIDAILKGLDKQISVLKINILDLISSILLIFILIPKYGINGYIFIIYFSEILNFTLSFYTLFKHRINNLKNIFYFNKHQNKNKILLKE